MYDGFFTPTNAKFGGYPVDILKSDYETLVRCKEVTGSLDQLKDWLQNHKNQFSRHYFGFGDKLSEIVRDGDIVKIACLSENYNEFVIKLTKFINEL